jgi:hypothetical protein
MRPDFPGVLSSFFELRQIPLAPVACHQRLADDAAVAMLVKPRAAGFPWE